MKLAQEPGWYTKAKAQAQEPAAPDWYTQAKALSKPKTPLRGGYGFLAGIGDSIAGTAASATGMVGEALGRFGKGMTRNFPGELTRSAREEPNALMKAGAGLKKGGEEYKAESRAALHEAYPKVAAGADFIGTAGPFVLGTAIAPEGMAPVAGAMVGSAMLHTQFRDDAKAHGASDEDADIAGDIGALTGAGAGLVSSITGPLARLLGRMPVPAKEILGTVAKDALAGGATLSTLNVVQNVTANSWVGYEKERKTLEGVLGSFGMGVGAGVVSSLLGLAAVPRPSTARSGEPAPLEPAKPGEIAPAQEAAPGEVPAPVEAQPVETPEPMAVSEASQPLPEQPPAQQPTETATPTPEATTPEAGVPAKSAPKAKEAKQADSGAAPSKLPDLTGVKNAEVDLWYEARGQEPPEHGERMEGKAAVADAAETLKRKPDAGIALVDDILRKPRPLDGEETALLSVEAVRRRNAYDEASADLQIAAEAGTADTDALVAKVNAASDSLLQLGHASDLAGTKWGQGGVARKIMLHSDYSLAETVRQIRTSKEGGTLSKDEALEAAKISKDFADRETALAEREAADKEREATAAAKGVVASIKERAKRNKAARVPSEFRDKLAKDAEVALDYFKNLGTRAHVGLPVDALPHLAKYGAHLIAKGATEFEAWSKAIIAEVGERAAPHLKEAWDAARKILHDASTENLAGRVGERLKAGKDATRYAKKLAEGFVREGIDQIEPLIDAVHGALKKIDPEITREKARDIMTGYGRFKPLTEDAAKRKLQDLVGQGQKLAQIEALEKKQAPKRTGFERVEPSQENRSLRRKVNQLRKESGIEVQDPARALKTALQTKETALRNRIEDLREELDTGERTVKDIKPSPSSPTTDALETELRQVREQHEAVFGKKGQTDLERAEAAIHATEKDIAENERKIRERDLSMAVGKQGPPTAEVAAARARHAELKAHNAALRAELEHMRALVEDQKPSPEEVRLQKQIDDFGKPKPGPRQGPDTEAVGKLRAELKTLRDAREAARKAEREKARKTPDQLRLAAAKARAKAEEEKLRGMIARGEFEKKKLKPIEPDAELTGLRVGVEKARAEIVKLREKHRLENRTKLAKAKDAAMEVVNLQRAMYSSFDASAVGRQGGFIAMGSNPVATASEMGRMFKAMASEDYSRRVDAGIRSSPEYDFAKASKLDLTSLDHEPGKGEEAIHSRLSDMVPGVRPSNRAFVTFLNLQRIRAFRMMVRAIPGTPTLADGRAIAHAVNVFTGRGESKAMASAIPTLQKFLWAPKLLLSRIQLLTGEPVWRATEATRPIIAKQYAKSIIGYAALYSLWYMALGGKVEDDPRSTNLGKLPTGKHTTNDPLTGLSQIAVVLSKLISGEKKTLTGKIIPLRGPKAGDETAWDVATGFARKKLTPSLGSFFNVVSGKDVVGNKVTLKSELGIQTAEDTAKYIFGKGKAPERVQGVLVPLSVSDIYAAMRAEGLSDSAVSDILGLLGWGQQTITPKRKAQ